MEDSSDDASYLSFQNLGSSSPGKKQSKENTITVSGSRGVLTTWAANWGFRPQMGCCHDNVDRAWKGCPAWNWEVPKLGCSQSSLWVPPFVDVTPHVSFWGGGGGEEKDGGWNEAGAISAGWAGVGEGVDRALCKRRDV